MATSTTDSATPSPTTIATLPCCQEMTRDGMSERPVGVSRFSVQENRSGVRLGVQQFERSA